MIKWIFIGIGLFAIVLLIWFGGPMVSFGESTPLASVLSRFIATIFVFVFWGGNIFWKKFKAKKTNDQFMAGLVAPVQEEPEQENLAATEDVNAIRNNFLDALSTLKKTKLHGAYGEQQLFELPWYIMIGPPGAGKTTALLNSGLRFPLRDQFGDQAMRGIGGTRGCDWWFSDEAVLIDTAGRYTTQDSDAEIDSAGWEGFLDLLKKYRKRRPINGVLVAISLADLLGQNEEERRIHASAIKRRIQELQKRLGIKFPVYVLFTKTDLIAGFMEFFDDLGKEERAQVWGMSFALDDFNNTQGVVNHFSSEFDALLGRINARLVARLHQERDIGRRAAIQNFPYQLASLKQIADNFLQEMFRPNQFEERSLLRGVYFTSGTQEGTPIDRVMGALANTFGLDRQAVPSFSGQGRSYFITNLFKQVIFQESGVGGTNLRAERQQTLLQWGSYAAAVVIAIMTTAIWTVGYTRNSTNIEIIQAHVTEYQRQNAKLYPDSMLQQTLPALYALQGAKEVFTQEPIGMAAILGLSKASTMEAAAEAAYQRALRAEFLPRLGQRLEIQLRTPNAPTDFLQGVLKVYLMLGDKSHLDPELVKLWMELDWKNAFSSKPSARQELLGHLTSLLSEDFEPLHPNETLVVLSRNKLSQVPLPERVYARIKQEALMLRGYSIQLSDVIGRSKQAVFTSRSGQGLGQIPALFTYKGFHDFYLKEGMRFSKEFVEETWVMGEQQRSSPIASNFEALNEQVRKLYISGYIQFWNEKLKDLAIVRFKNIDHGIEVLEALSGPHSPLYELLNTIAENTNLTGPKPGTEAVMGAIDAVTSTAKRLAQVLMAAQENTPVSGPGVPGTGVQKEFEPMIDLVDKSGDKPAPVESILAQLSELHAFLTEVSAADSSIALQVAAQRMASGSKDAIGQLRAKSSRLAGPMKTWMEEVAHNAWRIILSRARSHINSVWRLDVLPEYKHSFKNRYPIYKRSSQDVTLADFGRFFGVGGTADKFFINYLKPFVNTRRKQWQMRPLEGQTLPISRVALQTFQRARLIRNMYFTQGGQQPVVPFSLRPIKLDRNISRFSLDIDGQRISYRHGPSRWQKVQWPGPEGEGQARISFESRSGSLQSYSTDGQWSWFRLLDKSRVRRTSHDDRMRISFRVKKHTAKYELRANSVMNPFRLKSLSKFRAPNNL